MMRNSIPMPIGRPMQLCLIDFPTFPLVLYAVTFEQLVVTHQYGTLPPHLGR